MVEASFPIIALYANCMLYDNIWHIMHFQYMPNMAMALHKSSQLLLRIQLVPQCPELRIKGE